MGVEQLERHRYQTVVELAIVVAEELRAAGALPAAVQDSALESPGHVRMHVDVVDAEARQARERLGAAVVADHLLEQRTQGRQVQQVAPRLRPVQRRLDSGAGIGILARRLQRRPQLLDLRLRHHVADDQVAEGIEQVALFLVHLSARQHPISLYPISAVFSASENRSAPTVTRHAGAGHLIDTVSRPPSPIWRK